MGKIYLLDYILVRRQCSQIFIDMNVYNGASDFPPKKFKNIL